MSGDLLAIYLTDHLAGATAGTNRMWRLARHERSASDGALLAAIASEIEEDRQTLLAMVTAANVSPRWYKAAAAWIAEQVAVLKADGRLSRRSSLSSVLDLEIMRMGVTGKIALWESLTHTELKDAFDLDHLTERARRQLHELEAAHRLRSSAVAQRPAPAVSVADPRGTGRG